MRTIYGFCVVSCKNSSNFDHGPFDIQLFDMANSNIAICNIKISLFSFLEIYFLFGIVNLLNILLDYDITSPITLIFSIKSKVQRHLYYIFRLHNCISFAFHILKIYVSFHSFSYLHLIASMRYKRSSNNEFYIVNRRYHHKSKKVYCETERNFENHLQLVGEVAECRSSARRAL